MDNAYKFDYKCKINSWEYFILYTNIEQVIWWSSSSISCMTFGHSSINFRWMILMLDLNIYILWPLMGGAPDYLIFFYWLICKGQDNGRKWSRHHFTTFEGKDVEFFGRSGQDFAYPRFKKVVLMNCQLLRNQSTNRIRNLIEEREGKKAVFGGTYHVLGNVSYHKQERTWGRDAIFFLACYFWLPKKKKKWSRKGRSRSSRTNKQTNKS